jgi:hypothetical protein
MPTSVREGRENFAKNAKETKEFVFEFFRALCVTFAPFAYGGPASCPARDKPAIAAQHKRSKIKNERPFFFFRSSQHDS